MSTNRIILGINCGHDATAVLLKDGRVVSGVAEERLTRNKLQLGFPWQAIQEVLELGGVGPHEVSTVVLPHKQYLSAHPFFVNLIMDNNRKIVDIGNELSLFVLAKEAARQIAGRKGFSLRLSKTVRGQYARGYFSRSLQSLGILAPLVAVDHHMAHAASAYYSSGYGECLVITADGSGDGLSHTTYVGRNGELTKLYHSPLEYSPGVFYSAITKFLGFKRHRHEGKVTGLAAYGDADKLFPEFSNILCLSQDGSSFYSKMDFSFSRFDKLRWAMRLVTGSYFRSEATNYLVDFFKKHYSNEKPEDVAAGAQKCLEEMVVGLIANMVKKTGLRRIALAGGIFANVKLNQRILNLSGVEEIFIHPNMGDGGIALGGAYLSWSGSLKQKGVAFLPERIQNVYWGREYSEQQIHHELRRRGLQPKHFENVESQIADLLAKGLIVGRFNGRMEYGPRALGNRSILAEATDPAITDQLNKRLKRTEFMPFAPSILSEDAPEFYREMPNAILPAEFMTIACSVNEGVLDRAPAAHHVDLTARPHVVRKEVNESYHKVLSEYKKRTGLPLILNTSFNTHEYPIVCSPADAIDHFLRNAVDVLAIGSFIVLPDPFKHSPVSPGSIAS